MRLLPTAVFTLALALTGTTRAQTVLVSNLATTNNIGGSTVSLPPNTSWSLAAGFTTGSATMTLSSATLPLSFSSGPIPMPGQPDNRRVYTHSVYLFSSNGSVPTGAGSGGLLATSTSITLPANTGGFVNYTFNFSSEPVLSASTTYNLVLGITTLTGSSSTTHAWGASTDLSETGLPGWSIANATASSTDSGNSWSLSSNVGLNQAFRFSLSGGAVAIPEPSTYCAIIGSAALLLAAVTRRRKPTTNSGSEK